MPANSLYCNDGRPRSRSRVRLNFYVYFTETQFSCKTIYYVLLAANEGKILGTKNAMLFFALSSFDGGEAAAFKLLHITCYAWEFRSHSMETSYGEHDIRQKSSINIRKLIYAYSK